MNLPFSTSLKAKSMWHLNVSTKLLFLGVKKPLKPFPIINPIESEHPKSSHETADRLRVCHNNAGGDNMIWYKYDIVTVK